MHAAPTFTSADNTTFANGTPGSFTVTTTGSPTPTLSLTSGTLPAGVTFTANGNGTASLAGSSTASGSYPLTITAANGVAPDATQSFSLTITPLSCPAGQWLAQYYNGTALAGPVVGARCEASITNDWGAGGPTGVGVGVDNFSVRWSQTLSVPSAAVYSFSTRSDDGIRVSLDGSDVINNWTDHGPTTDLGSRALAVGDHPLVVGVLRARRRRRGAVQLRRRVSCPAGQWLAEYYTGTALAGPVVGARCEASITNDWGAGGPTGVGVGVDSFSVRWSQTLSVPSAAVYSFTTRSDDGIRVSLDGSDVINNWTDHGPTTDLGSRALAVGDHPLVVEYYERDGGAVAQFSYAAVSCPAGQWLAEYYTGTALAGPVVGARCEASITNDWGCRAGRPVSGSGWTASRCAGPRP